MCFKCTTAYPLSGVSVLVLVKGSTVTSHKDIQSLIDDLDGILSKGGSRLFWSKPGDVTRERQVLERVRSYLVSQQPNVVSTSAMPFTATTPTQAEIAQQVAQAVAQEMKAFQADLIQPLKTDLQALCQQRESLVQEIRQLERTRQEMDAGTQLETTKQQLISEFSQELINRCSASLTQEFAQLFTEMESLWARNQPTAPAIGSTRNHQGTVGSVMSPQERLEQLRQLQVQSDQLLTTLDTNQRVIFEALQRNLYSYQESLSQGLEKMHNLGAQGEMLFTALVNRLAQQLGREASTLLNSSRQPDTPSQASFTTSSETLLPSDASRGVEPNVSELSALIPEQLPTQPVSDSLTAEAQDNFSQTHNSEDWEIIAGLESENLEQELENSDRINNLLQLDIDPAASLLEGEEIETSSASDSQELDALLKLMNEQSTSVTPATTSPGMEAVNQAAELNFISDRRRQEIDDLYKSLFGTDLALNTTKLDESDSSEPIPAEISPPVEENQDSSPETVKSLPTQVEHLLFEGLIDPATTATPAETGEASVEPLAASWEVVFFEDAVTSSPIDQAGVGETLSSTTESGIEQEVIHTITTLTELLEEMGLSYDVSALNQHSITTPTPQPLAEQSSNFDPEISVVEDKDIYIPASPEEDLLATDELESDDPDLEIWLDQNTLQQLSEDLHSFEDAEGQTFRRQDEQMSSGNYFESLTVAPETTSPAQQYPQFLMPDELLAEDWEEFAFEFNSLSNQESMSSNLADTTTASTQDFEQGHGSQVDGTLERLNLRANDSIDLGFEPDLFPSESLELDQESAMNADAVKSNRESSPTELIALEDENEIVIDEMEWDEPTDSTTEEAIASSQLKLDSDAISPAVPELNRDEIDSKQQHSDPENNTVVSETLTTPQKLLAPGNSLSEDQRSNSLIADTQQLDSPNINHVYLPQDQALNPEQSDREKNNNRESNPSS